MKTGPIILVDDDPDDAGIMEAILKELKVSNKLIWFNNSFTAMEYLCTTADHPFLIFCDMNLPKQTGLEFKKEIDKDPFLRKKSIPFIFCSTSTEERTVNDAYMQVTVQGFFRKEHAYDKIRNTLKVVLEYWNLCSHPNSVL